MNESLLKRPSSKVVGSVELKNVSFTEKEVQLQIVSEIIPTLKEDRSLYPCKMSLRKM